MTPTPEMPEPVAHASRDWMRSITETEIALIPDVGQNAGRRDRVRSLYTIPLFTADQMRAYGEACAQHMADQIGAGGVGPLVGRPAPTVSFDDWIDQPHPPFPEISRRSAHSARVIADFKTGWDAGQQHQGEAS